VAQEDVNSGSFCESKMHPKDWLEYQLKIRAGKRYQMYQNHKLQKLLFGEKMFHAVFMYQQFSKTKDSLNLQVGRTELIQSILVVRQLYLADHLGLSDAVAFYIITYIYIYTHLFYQIY